ncbi:hypothetical protein NC651_019867 [Populus alba x Populus x berolinensis]|nr:hypothetical protein NC651_019867 [Populus alba x Populus x berolinensis]
MVHKIRKEIHRFGLAPNGVAAPFRHGLIGVIHGILYKVSSNVKYAAQMSPSWTTQNIQKKNPRCEFFSKSSRESDTLCLGTQTPLTSLQKLLLPNNFFPLRFVKLNL